MAGYLGVTPVPQATMSQETFVATSGQTTFATVGYPVGFVQVYLNGVKLIAGTDFTATNGSDVVLTVGAATGDTVEVISNSTFEVNNQNFTGATTVDTLTATGAITGTNLTLSGGVYLGGTGAANLLDDYEIGDWTPTLKCGTVVATLDHISGGSNIPATYTKIGRQVTIHAEVDVSNLNGGTAGVRISNLPFTVADDIYPTSLEASGSVSYFDTATGIGSISVVANSTSELLFYITTSSTQTTPTEMTGTHLGTGELRFTITYNTN